MSARTAVLAGLLWASACGGGDGGGDGGAGDDAGPTDDAAPGRRGFATEADLWPVPPSGTAQGFYTAAPPAPAGWALVDLDGDGRADLVQTADPASVPPAVWDLGGSPHWRVHLNEGDGFAATAITWSVPDAGTARGFDTVRRAGAAAWETVDVTGDGRPDLVQTSDPATGDVWSYLGGSHWRVHASTGAGFETTAMTWLLPDDPPGGGFTPMRALTADGAWDLRDLDGDGRLDLVHTAGPGAPLTAFNGGTEWRVYANGGGGFSATPLAWSLPPSPLAARGFFAVDHPSWSVADLDGDGRVELVQTGDPADAPGRPVLYDGVQPIWRVHRAGATGFGAAESWPVPLPSMPLGYNSIDSATASLHWTVFDIDGDAHPDLVHTANSAAATPSVWGSPDSDQWKVFPATPTGFAAEVTPWFVPDSGLPDGFFTAASSDQERSWLVTDLDGDGAAELVQTADPAERDGAVWDAAGAPHWRVHRAL